MKKKTVIDKIIDSGLVREGAYIIVGFSGGPDSLCLLHALAGIADSMDLSLVPVHVNHNLRPEAEEEADNAERICDRLGLDCVVFEADCQGLADEMNVSTEEAGRHIRYQIFDEVASQLESEGVPRSKIHIAVAHNADDQSETVLFRMIRGTGVHGLSGIPSVRTSGAGYVIIRPILEVTRQEVEDYIRDNKLHPNIDASNAGNDYTRNRIRNELIPYLEKNYNPAIRQTLRRYAELAGEDDAILQDIAFAELEEHIKIDEDDGTVTLSIGDLRNNPPSVNGRIAGFILNILGIEAYSSYGLIGQMISMIYTDNPSAILDLPAGLRARREYDSILYFAAAGDISISADESISIYPQILMRKDFFPDDDAVYAAFDFDLFEQDHPGKTSNIVLRTRREGDYIPIRGGRKKIQDLFVDCKIPRNARDSILMAAVDSEILWVLPSKYFSGERDREKGRFSPKYHISEATERVLFIEIADDV